MDTKAIGESLKQLHKTDAVRRIPRGMLDKLAPDIYEAVKEGVSLNQIRIHLEEKQKIKVTVRSIAKALRRNNFVPERSGRNTHNVCLPKSLV